MLSLQDWCLFSLLDINHVIQQSTGEFKQKVDHFDLVWPVIKLGQKRGRVLCENQITWEVFYSRIIWQLLWLALYKVYQFYRNVDNNKSYHFISGINMREQKRTQAAKSMKEKWMNGGAWLGGCVLLSLMAGSLDTFGTNWLCFCVNSSRHEYQHENVK